jgi:hypothetical protein
LALCKTETHDQQALASKMTNRRGTSTDPHVDSPLVEAIARRVAELLRGELLPASRLLTPQAKSRSASPSRAPGFTSTRTSSEPSGSAKGPRRASGSTETWSREPSVATSHRTRTNQRRGAGPTPPIPGPRRRCCRSTGLRTADRLGAKMTPGLGRYPMGRPATGEIRERRRRDGTVFYSARVRFGGRRHTIDSATPSELATMRASRCSTQLAERRGATRRGAASGG